MNCCVAESDLDPVIQEVNRMWRHNFLIRDGEKASPDEVHPSREDQAAVDRIKETLVFDKELGHYRVGLPWKNGREAAAQQIDNGAFEAQAKKRMMNTRNRMLKEPLMKEGVTAAIQKIIDEGHARRVTNPKVGPGIPVCTLPIHVVAQKGKFRVCQDGAAKVNGSCLNDFLVTGPDLMNRLPGVIMRFRQHRVAISADIKGFFHQIYLDKNDSHVYRFWWFEEGDEEMKVMVLLEVVVNTFGAKPSPFISTFVLRHHGETLRGGISEEVFRAIIRSFYVDDFLSSYPTT